MNPKIYVLCVGVEVTYMLGDGRVGVHRVNSDSIDSVVLCGDLILFLSMKFLRARVIER